MLRGTHPGLGRELADEELEARISGESIPFALSLSDDWLMCAEPGLTLLSLSPGQFETLAQGVTLFLAEEWHPGHSKMSCKEEFKIYFMITAQYVF